MHKLIASMILFVSCAVAASGAESMRVGIVIFDGFLTSEVTAPVEVFAKASSKGDIQFHVVTIASSEKIVASEEGLRLKPDHDFSNAPELDILIVPSSLDVDGVLANAPLVAFVEDRGSRARWLASNCSGAFLLGQAGLLKDRTVTTYVGGWDDLRERFPEANVVEEHVVVEGNLVSSIGGVTSYDAALTLLGEITNRKLTDTVAEALYYFPWLHRKTSQNSEQALKRYCQIELVTDRMVQ